MNSPGNSRENPRIITPDDEDEVLAKEFVRMLAKHRNRNRDEEENLEIRRSSDSDAPEDWKRQLDDEHAKWKKECFYNAAKRFAFDLHSDQSLEPVEQQEHKEEEEEEAEGDEEKSDFKKAKEAIKKRREDISVALLSTNLLTQSKKPPTLMELSARVLAKNSESIKSLKHVPDHLRKNLSNLVGDLSKLDARFMQLLIQDSPYEICARNCVNLTEEDLIQVLCDCDRVSLTVLTLDLCGRAMTEFTLNEFLKRSPIKFPSLTKLSLQGAFRLVDNALSLISDSSPLLQFINLSDCSLLTSKAVKILADKFGSTLRGLNIGGCQGMKRTKVFSNSLIKFEKLNYLSVAGLESINDGVVIPFLMFRSSNLTDLSLASCNEVTDECIWHIGRYCKKLEALDISDLDNLTESSLEFISEGCKSLNSINLSRNRFSDEDIAAFLEVLGGSLNQLCLNKVRDVGQYTAISLAKVCRRLRYLDLSWCRRLTEEQLRRILSGCWSLRSLKLFGWTQVEDKFLEELSRSQVHTGLKMTSLYDHLDDSYPTMNAKFF